MTGRPQSDSGLRLRSVRGALLAVVVAVVTLCCASFLRITDRNNANQGDDLAAAGSASCCSSRAREPAPTCCCGERAGQGCCCTKGRDGEQPAVCASCGCGNRRGAVPVERRTPERSGRLRIPDPVATVLPTHVEFEWEVVGDRRDSFASPPDPPPPRRSGMAING